ncbi:IS110 family RNA-guided transposase [Caldinitratiruptor microaerophilus]|uniref:IS110 family transposase n=1 Tax=Caldinitratiruptor microaerophilus TaxID=671077 RepID=UPI00222FDAB5|nr:IS110 family transposase [Caldinitratiruptor microaerophilus]
MAVGIDPAKRAHQAVAVLYPDHVMLTRTLRNRIEDIERLDDDVQALAAEHQAEVVYGLEDHRRYGEALLQVLQARGRRVTVVNPLWTHRQKDFYGQDKDDVIDARAIAAVVLRRGQRLPDATDAHEETAALREAERTLQDLSERFTRAMNRLHLQLSMVYLDTYETFFSDIKGPWAWRFFARFPYPQTLNGLTAPELAEVLRELAGGRVGPRSREASRQALEQQASRILEATCRLREQPATVVHRLRAELIGQLCGELLQIHESKGRLKHLLDDELLPAPGRSLMAMCGVGITLAATVVSQIGDIRRFPSRHAFAKYNGTAPAARSSGGRVRHAARKSSNHRLKRAMWLMALAAVRHDPLARAFYDRCRARGLSKLESLKRVARRMSDIVYTVLRSGQPYDRARVEASIRRRAEQTAQEPGRGRTPVVDEASKRYRAPAPTP